MGTKKLTYYNKTNHYYPLGMLLPNRHEDAKEYRYGFNGMEKDDEVSGEGNSYNFGARMYNPIVGKFLSLDKISDIYTGISDYVFVGNNPISRIDIDGNIWVDPQGRPIVTDNGTTSENAVPIYSTAHAGMTLNKGEFYMDIVHQEWADITIYANDGTPIQAKRLIRSYTEKNAVFKVNKADPENPIYIKKGTDENIKDKKTWDTESDCHGFTFAGNNIWINDSEVSKLIIADKWKPTTEKNSDIVVYKDSKNVSSKNVDGTVHSAKRNMDGTYDYNAGITTGGKNATLKEAGGGLTYDSTIFYEQTEKDKVYDGKKKGFELKTVGNTSEINLTDKQKRNIKKLIKMLNESN